MLPPDSNPDPDSVRAAFRNPRRLRIELLAGVTVALSLIPGTIAFSLIAGVDPQVGLFAACTVAIVISFTGGRRALISGPSAAIALILSPLMATHGLHYLLAAVILAGALQIVLSLVGITKLLRFVSTPILTGFVNALSILVALAQFPEIRDASWITLTLIVLGFAALWGFNRVSRAIPAPLLLVVLLTLIALIPSVNTPTVGQRGDVPSEPPTFIVPQIPFTFETLWILLPVSVSVAFIGLLESLLTAGLVDDLTRTRTNTRREAWGQGVANIASGFFGGMGGSGLLGQSMVNIKVAGARTRISTFTAGALLLLMTITISDVLALIPIAALVAIMIFVSAVTIDWRSLSPMRMLRAPAADTITMLATMAAILLTRNIAIGVGAGLLATGLFALIAHWRRRD